MRRRQRRLEAFADLVVAERLLHGRPIAPVPEQALRAVSGREQERAAAGDQALRDRVDRLAGEVDVEDRDVERFACLDQPMRGVDARRRPDDPAAESLEYVLDVQGDHRLVLDDEDAQAEWRCARLQIRTCLHGRPLRSCEASRDDADGLERVRGELVPAPSIAPIGS